MHIPLASRLLFSTTVVFGFGVGKGFANLISLSFASAYKLTASSMVTGNNGGRLWYKRLRIGPVRIKGDHRAPSAPNTLHTQLLAGPYGGFSFSLSY